MKHKKIFHPHSPPIPKSNDEEAIVLIIAAILIVYLSFCIFITVDTFANDGRER